MMRMWTFHQSGRMRFSFHQTLTPIATSQTSVDKLKIKSPGQPRPRNKGYSYKLCTLFWGYIEIQEAIENYKMELYYGGS